MSTENTFRLGDGAKGENPCPSYGPGDCEFPTIVETTSSSVQVVTKPLPQTGSSVEDLYIGGIGSVLVGIALVAFHKRFLRRRYQ